MHVCSEHEEVYIHALHELDFDLPGIADNDDNIGGDPSLQVGGFSDNKEEETNASLSMIGLCYVPQVWSIINRHWEVFLN